MNFGNGEEPVRVGVGQAFEQILPAHAGVDKNHNSAGFEQSENAGDEIDSRRNQSRDFMSRLDAHANQPRRDFIGILVEFPKRNYLVNAPGGHDFTGKIGTRALKLRAFLLCIFPRWFSNGDNVRLGLSQFFESMGNVHGMGFLETVSFKMSNRQLLFEIKFVLISSGKNNSDFPNGFNIPQTLQVVNGMAGGVVNKLILLYNYGKLRE